MPLAPSRWLSLWIKVDKWNYFHLRLKDFFFLVSVFIFIQFFEYENIVKRNMKASATTEVKSLKCESSHSCRVTIELWCELKIETVNKIIQTFEAQTQG